MLLSVPWLGDGSLVGGGETRVEGEVGDELGHVIITLFGMLPAIANQVGHFGWLKNADLNLVRTPDQDR